MCSHFDNRCTRTVEEIRPHTVNDWYSLAFVRPSIFKMKEIVLTKGFVAFVSDEDFEELSKCRWAAIKAPSGIWYASRGGGKRGVRVSMHRQILGITDPKIIVDHQNGNGLDNQRKNIRVATKSQNAMNRAIDKRSTTGFKCVSKYKGKYRAYIVVGYKQKGLGVYNCPIEAAKAYDRAAIELHKEFANLNFPQQSTP